MRVTLLAIFVLFAAAPLAIANEPDPNGNCNNVGDDTLEIAGIDVTAADTPLGTIYVTGEPGVWTESNGLPGLQDHAHTCRTSPREAAQTYGPDTRVL